MLRIKLNESRTRSHCPPTNCRTFFVEYFSCTQTSHQGGYRCMKDVSSWARWVYVLERQGQKSSFSHSPFYRNSLHSIHFKAQSLVVRRCLISPTLHWQTCFSLQDKTGENDLFIPDWLHNIKSNLRGGYRDKGFRRRRSHQLSKH